MFLLIKKFSALNLFTITLTFDVINAQNSQIINSKNGKKACITFCHTCGNGYCLYDTCACSSGYEGLCCDRRKDYCRNFPCKNGYCVNDILFGYECKCYTGYTGKNCETRDYCNYNPCKNGYCVSGLYGYTCSCYSGYEGSRCETKIESPWIYYLIGSFVALTCILICCFYCCQSKKTRLAPTNRQAQLNVLPNNFQDINRFSTNPVRQISTTESIYSFETALQNSTMIVQEKNETLEFKLPSYDEFIKGNSNEAFEFSNNNEASSTL